MASEVHPHPSESSSPYTCTTISPPESPYKSDRPFLSITSYALSDEAAHSIKYSISNILQPEFGRRAILRTKSAAKCRTQIGRSMPSPPPEAKAPEEEIVEEKTPRPWPAWVYCTRYSDRPSSGPRSRRLKKPDKSSEEKRPRTAFSGAQLARLKHEFAENRYLTERRRQHLSQELNLNEAQIKIWFQNKRAKIKKSTGQKHPLALQLMAQGLYNHTTVACDEDDVSSEGIAF